MNEPSLTNLDGVPQYIRTNTPSNPHVYHTPVMRPTNMDNSSRSMTIIVQNPFDDPINTVKYLPDPSQRHSMSNDASKSPHTSSNAISVSRNILPQHQSIVSNQHPVRFNQELLHNFGINVSTSRSTDAREHSSTSSVTTSLIPLPHSLSNNLGFNNINHMNQPSITPTIIGTYSTHQTSLSKTYTSAQTNFDNHHNISTTSYINNSHPFTGKINQPIRASGGVSPMIINYPATLQTQQTMKPRMMPPNAYGASAQVIMPQQPSVIYNPSAMYPTNAPTQVQHLTSDNNSLQSLLQTNMHIKSQLDAEMKPTINSNDHSQTNSVIPTTKTTKPRRKRKGNDPNTSLEEDMSVKPVKRTKKGMELTEKLVENSLQQLRNLPMLTPIEPPLSNTSELNLSLNISEKSSKYQGDFGHVFIETLTDFYRPNRQMQLKSLTRSSAKLERHYRLCSSVLDRPPTLPSPPLMTTSSEKLFELTRENNETFCDESIISTSFMADDDDYDDSINDMESENIYLLKPLSSSYDRDSRLLSPIFSSNENDVCKSLDQYGETTMSNLAGDNPTKKDDRPLVEGTDKVSVTLTLTTEAANNVQSVMAAVADLLKIAYPSTFDVHQTLTNNNSNCGCLTTMNNLNPNNNNDNNNNNNNLLSLYSQVSSTNPSALIYRIGRETNVNIQSLIDGQPKYCRHCSQLIVPEIFFKKRHNELPAVLRELTPNAEPIIYFCNEQCYSLHLANANNQVSSTTQIKNESMDTSSSLPSTKFLVVKSEADVPNQLSNSKRWKRWNPNLLMQMNSSPSNTQEIDQLMAAIQIPLSLNGKQDKRTCVFCNGNGDMKANGPGRLLNLDIGQWCHLNCALWSSEVYETVSGALMSVEQAHKRSINTECIICKQKGASLTCFYQRCSNSYHLTCAIDNGVVFYKNKSLLCPTHAAPTVDLDQTLVDKSVLRKVWINRDEIKQIQNYMNEEHDDKSYTLRIGTLVLHNIGQLLPHQLQSSTFHNRNFIYPVGYTATRFYWSMRYPNRRCAYLCSIIDMENKPMFRVRVHENESEQSEEFIESNAKDVWWKVIREVESLRQKHHLVKMFPVYVKGEDFFGLTEPHITRLIESLPGVEVLQNYAFKYGRLQLFDMPLTLNPTGCARSEPKLRTHFRRHAQPLTNSHATRSVVQRSISGVETAAVPYGKQFVLPKSTQYRKLKTEWRQNVYLAKSRIQGLGLFAARDLEKHTMVIEYVGEVIRNEVANKREKLYEQQNRGIYMFRLDDDNIIDATVSGCLARYINHSCEPNAITEVVQFEKENKIVIIANRRIGKGEEISYDYKFNFEDDCKIPCLCGAVNCRNWMN